MENEIKYRGFTIRIEQDDYPPHPRKDADNFGTVAYKHRCYQLGEEEINDPVDWLAEKLKIDETEFEKRGLGYDNDTLKELADELCDGKHGYVALPVYLYDHSGLTMSVTPFGCRWDSGQAGFIYAGIDKVKEEFGDDSAESVEKAKALMKNEIETLDQYLQGEVYGYRVITPEGEDIDSCRGYYGDPEESGCIDEAKAIVDCEMKKRGEQLFIEFKD